MRLHYWKGAIVVKRPPQITGKIKLIFKKTIKLLPV